MRGQSYRLKSPTLAILVHDGEAEPAVAPAGAVVTVLLLVVGHVGWAFLLVVDDDGVRGGLGLVEEFGEMSLLLLEPLTLVR